MSVLGNEGMAIAPGVVETIVSLAAKEVPGVESVGRPSKELIHSVLHRNNTQGVTINVNEDETISVDVHISARAGLSRPDVADQVRTSIHDAVLSQVGLEVASVEVYVEAVRFVD